MQNEILKTLTVLGWQPTTSLTYAFGTEFGAAIRALHARGKVERYRNGWRAV